MDNATDAVRSYRPSNGTEGMSFMDHFCGRCARDAAFRRDEGDSCPIAAAATAYRVDEPEYPTEWQCDDKHAWCAAFEPEDGSAPALIRDARQVEMFA